MISNIFYHNAKNSEISNNINFGNYTDLLRLNRVLSRNPQIKEKIKKKIEFLEQVKMEYLPNQSHGI